MTGKLTPADSKFDAYGDLAQAGVPATMQNGRYEIQAEAEKLIFPDVKDKLQLSPSDDLLDIGCGAGTILIPASRIVSSVTGIDHPKVVERLGKQIKANNAILIGGDFLDVPLPKKFSKIALYSILPALPDRETVLAFIEKSLSLLRPNGRLLIGDIANADKKKRFSDSARGKAFIDSWNREMAKLPPSDTISAHPTTPTASFDDEFVFEMLRLIRKKGFHAYLVDQPQGLPFGNSREDILVIGPEYDESKAGQ